MPPRACISLDLSKAFDFVDWNIVQMTLVLIGFYRSFTRMIMKCITTPSFSLLIKGEVMAHISSGQGLPQGDPLSSLLFSMVLENLSQDLHLVESNKNIDTYICNGWCQIGDALDVHRQHLTLLHVNTQANYRWFFAIFSGLKSIIQKARQSSRRLHIIDKSFLGYSGLRKGHCRSSIQKC